MSDLQPFSSLVEVFQRIYDAEEAELYKLLNKKLWKGLNLSADDVFGLANNIVARLRQTMIGGIDGKDEKAIASLKRALEYLGKSGYFVTVLVNSVHTIEDIEKILQLDTWGIFLPAFLAHKKIAKIKAQSKQLNSANSTNPAAKTWTALRGSLEEHLSRVEDSLRSTSPKEDSWLIKHTIKNIVSTLRKHFSNPDKSVGNWSRFTSWFKKFFSHGSKSHEIATVLNTYDVLRATVVGRVQSPTSYSAITAKVVDAPLLNGGVVTANIAGASSVGSLAALEDRGTMCLGFAPLQSAISNVAMKYPTGSIVAISYKTPEEIYSQQSIVSGNTVLPTNVTRVLRSLFPSSVTDTKSGKTVTPLQVLGWLQEDAADYKAGETLLIDCSSEDSRSIVMTGLLCSFMYATPLFQALDYIHTQHKHIRTFDKLAPDLQKLAINTYFLMLAQEVGKAPGETMHLKVFNELDGEGKVRHLEALLNANPTFEQDFMACFGEKIPEIISILLECGKLPQIVNNGKYKQLLELAIDKYVAILIQEQNDPSHGQTHLNAFKALSPETKAVCIKVFWTKYKIYSQQEFIDYFSQGKMGIWLSGIEAYAETKCYPSFCELINDCFGELTNEQNDPSHGQTHLNAFKALSPEAKAVYIEAFLKINQTSVQKDLNYIDYFERGTMGVILKDGKVFDKLPKEQRELLCQLVNNYFTVLVKSKNAAEENQIHWIVFKELSAEVKAIYLEAFLNAHPDIETKEKFRELYYSGIIDFILGIKEGPGVLVGLSEKNKELITRINSAVTYVTEHEEEVKVKSLREGIEIIDNGGKLVRFICGTSPPSSTCVDQRLLGVDSKAINAGLGGGRDANVRGDVSATPKQPTKADTDSAKKAVVAEKDCDDCWLPADWDLTLT